MIGYVYQPKQIFFVLWWTKFISGPKKGNSDRKKTFSERIEMETTTRWNPKEKVNGCKKKKIYSLNKKQKIWNDSTPTLQLLHRSSIEWRCWRMRKRWVVEQEDILHAMNMSHHMYNVRNEMKWNEWTRIKVDITLHFIVTNARSYNLSHWQKTTFHYYCDNRD